MKKLLYLTIFIFGLLLMTKFAHAGIIIRPVFHTGLVGYWNFQEGAGDTAYDKSGYDNDGTLEASMTESDWVDGKLGKALDFDGSDDYVDLGESQWDGSWMNHTITAWMKWTGKGINTTDTIISKGGGSPNGFWYEISQGPGEMGTVAFHMNSVMKTSSTKLTPGDGLWHFLAVTLDSSNIYFYLDSNADGSDTHSYANDNNTNMWIGQISGGDEPFNGAIDEVRIYNRALSAGEVERLYRLSQPKFLAPTRTGLVGYWPFEEGTGTKAGDHSGQGNNGDLQNMEEADWVDGKLGTALDFDGNNEYVELNNNILEDLITTGSTITISLWFNTDATDYAHHLIWEGESTGNGWSSNEEEVHLSFGRRVGIINSDDYITFYFGDLEDYPDGGNPINLFYSFSDTTSWHHVVVVFDSTADSESAEMFLDGTSVGIDTGNVNAGLGWGTNTRIGTDGANSDRQFDGIIDEVRIYNRALETSEIEALYKSGRAKFNTSQNDKLTGGLVGLWSFNGPDMDGDTAYDRSGEGNDGTLSGDPTPTIGRIGQALDFDGVDDYVNFGDQDDLIGANYSFLFWAKKEANTSTGNRMSLISKLDDGTAEGIDIITGNSYTNLEVYIDRTSSPLAIANFLDLNSWVFGAVVLDNGTVSVYKNGVFQNSASYTSITDNDVNFYIGTQGALLTRVFNGIIDEVRVYNRALSAKEIQRLYNLGR